MVVYQNQNDFLSCICGIIIQMFFCCILNCLQFEIQNYGPYYIISLYDYVYKLQHSNLIIKISILYPIKYYQMRFGNRTILVRSLETSHSEIKKNWYFCARSCSREGGLVKVITGIAKQHFTDNVKCCFDKK